MTAVLALVMVGVMGFVMGWKAHKRKVAGICAEALQVLEREAKGGPERYMRRAAGGE